MSKKNVLFFAIVFLIQSVVQALRFYEHSNWQRATLFVLSLLAALFFFGAGRKNK